MTKLSELNPKKLTEIYNLCSKRHEIQQKIEEKHKDFEKSLQPLELTLADLTSKIDSLEGETSNTNGKPSKGQVKAKKGTPRGATKKKVVKFLLKRKKGATQVEIANKTGVSPAYINYLLADKTVFVKQSGRGGIVRLRQGETAQ